MKQICLIMLWVVTSCKPEPQLSNQNFQSEMARAKAECEERSRKEGIPLEFDPAPFQIGSAIPEPGEAPCRKPLKIDPLTGKPVAPIHADDVDTEIGRAHV